MNKRFTRGIATFIAAHGGISAPPAAEATSFHEMTAIEQVTAAGTDVGKTADNASSADDIAKKAKTVHDQLASETDAHQSPDAGPEGDDPQKILLDLEGDQEEEKLKKADEDLALGDHEEVSSGNVTAPAPPADRESAVTGEEQAQRAASAEQERSWAAAEADKQRAEAAAEADQQRAEAAARADGGSHQHAATEDEERFGRPAEESEPADETWMEDDVDVNDPDID